MKRSITTLIACALCTMAHSQTASWSWAREGVGPSDDMAHDVATDPSGNIYSTGVFAGTTSIVFGTHTLISRNVPNSHAEPNKDIFLVKYHQSGSILWAMSGGGSQMERSYVVDTDAAGNVYIGGSSSSTVLTIGTITISKGASEDFFVAKLDPAGNALWIRTGTGNSQNYVKGLAADNSGNVVVTGFNIGTEFSIGSHSITNPSGAVFVAKYDTQGNVLWVRSSYQETDSYFAFGQSVDVDHRNGDIFVGGYFANKYLAFGTHTLTNGKNGIDPTEDIFLVKYNAAGNVMWAKSFGGVNNERGMAVSVATSADQYFSSDVYLGGHFAGAVLAADSKTLTNTNPSFGQQDIFVLKLEAHTGKVMWASQLSGQGRDLLDDLTTIGNAGVALSATFASSVISSGNLTAAKTNSTGGNSTDILVAGFDMNGQAVLLKAAGGDGLEEAGGVAADRESLAIYINGEYTSNPARFDANEIGTNGIDVFTARLAAPEYEKIILLGMRNDHLPEWTAWPNPTSEMLTLTTGEAHGEVTLVVYNLFGQEVRRLQYSDSDGLNVDLSELSAGIYHVDVITERSRSIVKVVKN